MAKIIKLDFEEVVIAEDDNNLIRLPYEELDFKPELHDEVDIYPDGETFIVTKKKVSDSSIEDKININIVNDNTQQQSNNNNVYAATGKVVNKVVYILLAIFLGTFGIHKFYARKFSTGLWYLAFCWTGIPWLVSIIEGIVAIFKPADSNGNIII